MSKGIMISFRTTAELTSALKRLAQCSNTTLSSLIDSVLQDYLESQVAEDSLRQDRRRFPRQHETIPAIISGQNGARDLFHASKITNLSLGGVSIVVPRDDLTDACINDRLDTFEVIFALPRQEKPITIQCQAKRIHRGMGGYLVGASFAGPDRDGSQVLRGYLG
jgi:hypothetical protein